MNESVLFSATQYSDHVHDCIFRHVFKQCRTNFRQLSRIYGCEYSSDLWTL